MATRHYRRDTTTRRNVLFVREKKQGAPIKPDDIKQAKRVTANLTDAQRAEFDRQKPVGMKDAAFAAQLICQQLFVTKIC